MNFQKTNEVIFHASGVGAMATTFSLVKMIEQQKPALVIQVGIAGAFANTLLPGEVVVVESDCNGDLVVEEKKELIDVFDLGLADKNEEVFGVCANENWHGHNFDLYVTIKGKPDADTGFLFDVKKLSKLIREHIIEQLDHKNLNMDVDFLKGKMCSTENLAIGIWQQLQPHLPGHVQLHCIKLYETPRIYVEYFGE